MPVARPGPRGPCPWGKDRAPGGPGGVLRTPGPRFTSLAGGRAGLICRLIVVLPKGTAAKTSPWQPRLPGYGEQQAPAAGGKIKTAAGASGDLGRVAGRPGVGITTVTPTPPPGAAPHGARQVTTCGPSSLDGSDPYFGPDPVSWRGTFGAIWRAAWCAAAVCRRRAAARRRRRGHRRGGGSRRRPPRARESVTAIAGHSASAAAPVCRAPALDAAAPRRAGITFGAGGATGLRRSGWRVRVSIDCPGGRGENRGVWRWPPGAWEGG